MQNIESLIEKIDRLDDEINALLLTVPNLENLRKKRAEANETLELALKDQATTQLHNKDYGCGTVNLEAGRYEVKVTIPKKIKYDQDRLFEIRDLIREGGKDIKDYGMKEELKVSETAYKKLPRNIQEVFEPAREVFPGKPKIQIVRKRGE